MMPTISTSSPALTLPCSMRPVTTVPRPSIENTSSTGMMKFLSMLRTGCGMKVSTASIRSEIGLKIGSVTGVLASSAFCTLSAEPRMIGVSSPGNSYLLRSSRISISTRSSSSGSSTWSTLFMNTTMAGTFTWRASRMCSRVWGIGPSAAETTRMAPSIWAAPVIMFLMKSAWPGQSTCA